ncbi:MAG: arylsulfotransferase family protein [Spirochaetales bacterium]|nr:arylsulfotransferase family protein [Spirochaetales bacterium]
MKIYLFLFIAVSITITTVSCNRFVEEQENTLEEAELSEGYVLFSVMGDDTVYLVDTDEDAVKTWTSSYNTASSCYLTEDLTLIRAGITTTAQNGTFSSGGSVSGILEELDYDSAVLWSITMDSDEGTFHHDLKQIDSQTVIALCWELRTYEEEEYWNERVLIIDKTDNSIDWEWNAMDDGQIYPETSDDSDYIHFNSVDYNEGKILLSSRQKDTLYIIDEDTKSIEYQLTAGGELSGQHDATFLDSGNILVFNNRLSDYSEVLEIEIETDNIAWEYSNDFFSSHISGTQRLDSGNTLICSGTEGRILEVTEDGEEVWDYTSPYEVTQGTHTIYSVFKARKYTTY